jgi:tetratricopeptide (TPR) repeat protein
MARLIPLLERAGFIGQAASLRGELREILRSIVRRRADTHQAVARRARANVRLGRFEDAAADFDACTKSDPTDLDPWVQRACILAYLDKRDAHAQLCDRLRKQFGQTTDRLTAYHTARTYLLFPRSPAEREMIKPMVNLAVLGEETYNSPWFRMLKGLAEYRSARYAQAIETLNQCRDDAPPNPGAAPTIDLLLAMSHFRQNDSESARISFKRAQQAIEAQLSTVEGADLPNMALGTWLVMQTVYREARTLVNPR